MTRNTAIVIGLLFWFASRACADYALPDLEKVPVARLVANLTKLTEAEPKTVEHQLNLARAHAMAEYGIVSLSCRSEVLKDHPDRIAHSPCGVTFRDGRTRPTFDVILKTVETRDSGVGLVNF